MIQQEVLDEKGNGENVTNIKADWKIGLYYFMVQKAHPSTTFVTSPRIWICVIIFSEILWYWNSHEDREAQYEFYSKTVQVAELEKTKTSRSCSQINKPPLKKKRCYLFQLEIRNERERWIRMSRIGETKLHTHIAK